MQIPALSERHQRDLLNQIGIFAKVSNKSKLISRSKNIPAEIRGQDT
jgi:hypothetical protein